jgi:hypothetical protein
MDLFVCVCVQANYMADDADDPASDRFLEVYLLWLFRWVRISGRLGVAVPAPMGSEDRRRTPRADAPDQLGQRCSGSYLQGAVFGSVEADE